MDRPPLLLLPGWNGRPREMRHLARHLVQHGWPEEHVCVCGFRDIWGSNIEHAEEIREAIHQLRARAGADHVDIIAFSMSGLAVRWYLAHTPQPPVRKVVFIATPHRGTILAHLGWGKGAREMRPGSPFLQKLSQCRLPDGVRAYTVRTTLETRVFPASHAKLDAAAADYVIRSATHTGMLRSARVCSIVCNCLLAQPT